MGEYAPSDHFARLTGYPADSLKSRASETHFTAYIAQQAKANGVIPYLWAGIFNRPANNGVPTGPAVVGDQVTLDSVKVAVNRGIAKPGSELEDFNKHAELYKISLKAPCALFIALFIPLRVRKL